jgi:hypothetical protein
MPTPQYNAVQYNTASYDATVLLYTLTDSQGSSDARVAEADPVLLDAEMTMAALVSSVLNGKFEFVTLSEPEATAPAIYNTFSYNARMYNQPSAAGFAKVVIAPKLDVLIPTDSISSLASFFRTLPESLSASDITSILSEIRLAEAIVIEDSLTKQITDKRMTAAIRLNDWLEVKQSPQSDQWGN